MITADAKKAIRNYLCQISQEDQDDLLNCDDFRYDEALEFQSEYGGDTYDIDRFIYDRLMET